MFKDILTWRSGGLTQFWSQPPSGHLQNCSFWQFHTGFILLALEVIRLVYTPTYTYILYNRHRIQPARRLINLTALWLCLHTLYFWILCHTPTWTIVIRATGSCLSKHKTVYNMPKMGRSRITLHHVFKP